MLTICEVCEHLCPTQEVPAMYFCKTCYQYICCECYERHQLFGACKSHEVYCLSDPQRHVICAHNAQPLKYCEAHKELFCEECTTEKHMACKPVLPLESYLEKENALLSEGLLMLQNLKEEQQHAENTNKIANMKEICWIQRLSKALEELDEAKKELDVKISIKVDYIRSHMKKMQEDTRTKINKIAKATQVIKGDLGNVQTKAASKSNKLKFQTMQNLTIHLNECKTLLNSDVDACHIDFLKAEHKFEAEHYVSGTLMVIKQKLQIINEIYTKIQHENWFLEPVEQESLQEEILPEVFEQPIEETYGHPENRTQQVNRKPSTHSENDEHLKPYKHLLHNKDSISLLKVVVKKDTSINVRVENDKEICGVTGIALLGNSYLIMADYSNSKLKLFTIDGRLVEETHVCDIPRDISRIDDATVIVTYPMAQKIQVVQVKMNSMVLGRIFCIKAKCCGVAFHDNRFYVATQMPHQILIINMEGIIEKRISGDNLFERATYITVDPETSIIYISDPSKKCILGIDEEKTIKFLYAVDASHGITCAGQGSVYVADWETSSIHLVSKESKAIGDLTLKDCHCPQKIVYYQDRNMLLVTQWLSNEVIIVTVDPKQ